MYVTGNGQNTEGRESSLSCKETSERYGSELRGQGGSELHFHSQNSF